MSYLLKNPNYDANFASLKLEDNLIVENVQINNNLQVDEDTLLNNLEITGVCVIPSISLDNINAKTLSLKLNTQPNIELNANNAILQLQDNLISSTMSASTLNINEGNFQDCTTKTFEIMNVNNIQKITSDGTIMTFEDASTKLLELSTGLVALKDNVSANNLSSLSDTTLDIVDNTNNFQTTITADNIVISDPSSTCTITTSQIEVEQIKLGSTSQYLLPSNDGLVNQVIATDGLGQCSFVDLPSSLNVNFSVDIDDSNNASVNTLLCDFTINENIVCGNIQLQQPSFTIGNTSSVLISDPNIPIQLLPNPSKTFIKLTSFHWLHSNQVYTIDMYLKKVGSNYKFELYNADNNTNEYGNFSSGSWSGFTTQLNNVNMTYDTIMVSYNLN
jgi:hypothetical protein